MWENDADECRARPDYTGDKADRAWYCLVQQGQNLEVSSATAEYPQFGGILLKGLYYRKIMECLLVIGLAWIAPSGRSTQVPSR